MTATTATEFPTENRMPLKISAFITITLGVLALAMPFIAGVAATYFLAANFIIGGLFMLFAAVSAKAWAGSLGLMVLGAVSFIGGLFIFGHPLIGLSTVTLFCIGAMFAAGIAKVFWSFRLKVGEGKWFLVLSGILSIIVAAMLFKNFPFSAQWAFGVLVGINLLVEGVSLWAFAQKHH
jgi:membrane protein HdeD